MSEMRQEDAQKWSQPSGLDIADYEGHEKWGYLRWAWEFLRRNIGFKKECLKADELGKTSRSEVAKKFHLNKYKPYWEEFRSVEKGHKRAKFVTRNLKFWIALEGSAKPPRNVEVKLQDGEILVRLPVWAAAELTRSSLTTLLKSTRRLAHVFLEEFLNQEHRVKSKKSRNRVESGFLPYLRLLDLETYCSSLRKADLSAQRLATHADRFLALYGSDEEKERRNRKGEGDGFGKQYREIKRRAVDLAEANYLHIAALKPKFPKSFRKEIKEVKTP